MSALPWGPAIRRGLGGPRTIALGVLLIGIGVLGKLALLAYSNVETVFVVALLAGSVLGRWWTVLVPAATLAILQPILWAMQRAEYGVQAMIGITFFVVSGYLFIGVMGRSLKPRVVARVKSVALLTTVSVPLTIAYDVWTATGEWYFLVRPYGVSWLTVMEAQVPFTLYHLLSSLIFVPLFGSAFLVAHTHLAAEQAPGPAPAGIPSSPTREAPRGPVASGGARPSGAPGPPLAPRGLAPSPRAWPAAPRGSPRDP